MENKQIFSIRKTVLGVGSVLLGTLIFGGGEVANAETVEKKFNDITETVEVVGENRVISEADVVSLSEGNSLYLLVEEDGLDDDDNSETNYERFIKITPTSNELATGIKYPYDYIESKYKEGIRNSTILTKEEIEKQGGFKENDLIITGTNTELFSKSSYNLDKIYEKMDEIKLPYIYYPEKSITWNPAGNDELTYDLFTDKLDIVPVDSSITKNESVVVRDNVLNYDVTADSFTFKTTIDGEDYKYTGDSTISNRNFSISKRYKHEKGSLDVNYMFYYNPSTKEVEYIGKRSILLPKGKPEGEVPTHVYNVGIAMKTTDNRVTTQLTNVFSGKGPIYYRNIQFKDGVMKRDVPYIHGYYNWADLLLSYNAKYSSVFHDSGDRARYTPRFYLSSDDPNDAFVVWRDGKEPTPLKPGEKLVKEYKIYFNGQFRLERRNNYDVTDWKTVTFVGDTTQYDSDDDFKELDAKEIDKIGTGKPFEWEFDSTYGILKSKDFYDIFIRDKVHGKIDKIKKYPSDNDYSVDGTHREFYEERKRVNFETNSTNLEGYDGVSWDLVPTYYEHGGDTIAGYLSFEPYTTHYYRYMPGCSRATLSVYRVSRVENGSVVVAYENESGEVIKDEETLIDNQPVGTRYTSEPADTIVGTDGQTYYKVKLKDGSQSATGDVTKETKKVTWVYRLPEVTDVKGKVVVKYVDTEGRELLTEYATDEKVVATVVNRFTENGEKQLVSSTPTNETYDVEDQKHPKITDQNIVYNFKEVQDSKPLAGTLAEGEIVITLVYEKTPTETREETGHVKVIYTDENEREIDTAVVKPDEAVNRIVEQPMVDGTKTTVSTTPTNATYDVTSDKKERIEFDGFTYTFKQVKDVQPTGTLSVGETVVTYVYEVVPKVETLEEKGTVKVKFVDSTGRVIRDEVVLFTDELVNTKTTTLKPDEEPVIKDTPTNTEYNAGVSTVKLGEIEFEEFRYVFKSQDGETPLTGKIPVGETVITFVYDIEPKTSVTEEKGTVKVKYVDENGKELKETLVHKNDIVVNRITTSGYPENYTGEKAEPVSAPTNEEYDTTGDDIKLPSIDFEDYTYNFLKQKENDPAPKGKVVKGETVITYVYRAVPKTNDEQQKGTVKVRYVDTDGNILRDDTILVNDQLVNTRTRVSKPGVEDEFTDAPTNIEYDASLPTVKFPKVDNDDYTYNFVRQKSNEPLTGKVTTGETLITFVYEVLPKESRVEKKGSVVVRFVTEDGVELKKDVTLLTDELVSTTITKTRPNKDDEVITNETGKRYDSSTIADEYLEKEGIRYKKVRVDGVESGKLPEGETTITYVYKNWMPKVEETKQYGNVVVRYLEKGTEKELLAPKDALENTLVNTHKKVTSPEGEVAESDVPTNSTYDVTEFKYPFVTSEGVKYNWVSEDKPVIGTLPTGELVITFYYELNSNGVANTTENGTVIVKYQDDMGNDLKEPVKVKDNVVVNNVKTETFKDGTADKVTKEPTGETYDTTGVKESEIEHEGFIYRLTPKVTGKETGDVPVGITEVVYIYEAVPKVEETFEKGSVIVHFRDKDGNELVESKKIVDEANVSKITVTTTPKHGERVVDDLNVEYDATTVREDEIVVKGIKYKRIVDRIDGIEKGKVEKGDTVVIYYYEEVKEEPKEEPKKPEPPKEEPKKPEPKPQPKPQPKPESKPQPKPEPKPVPEPTVPPKPQPKPEPVVPPKEDGEPVAPKPQPEPVVEQPVVENKQETNIPVSEALELPSTGEQDLSIFAPAVLSILSAVGLIGYSRKED